MTISKHELDTLVVQRSDDLVLEVKKALYGLKQAGRLWSQLLHSDLTKIGFTQSLTDMYVYFRTKNGKILIVGV